MREVIMTAKSSDVGFIAMIQYSEEQFAIGLGKTEAEAESQARSAYVEHHGQAPRQEAVDRKSVVEGKSVSVRVDLGGRRMIKKKKAKHNYTNHTRAKKYKKKCNAVTH